MVTGGLCAILAMFVVKNSPRHSDLTLAEHARRFDYFGALTFSAGLVLILIAMVQGVVADPVLSQPRAIVGLVVAGAVAGLAFVVDQFYAVDPLIPPSIFRNRTFALTTLCGTLMAFVRNSIIYNMIFFLQGPYGMDPLQAGINLIPYGVGIMVAGFSAGALADRLGIRNMAVLGPLVNLAGAALLCVMNQHTSQAYVSGSLLLAGLGVGTFQSPNSTANMLSVPAARRGVAAAIGMLTMTFCMMTGIVLTFSFVLHSMTSAELFNLFIYGGQGAAAAGLPVQACLDALALDYYLIMAADVAASVAAAFLPGDLHATLRHPTPAAPAAGEGAGEEAGKPASIALQVVVIDAAAGDDVGAVADPQRDSPPAAAAAG